jgi:phospholipid/cholesterol/gamma-HCH transport system permease protein
MREEAARDSTEPQARLESDSGAESKRGTAVLRLSGAWRLAHLPRIEAQLSKLTLPREVTVDGSGLVEIDSAGALALLTGLAGSGIDPASVQLAGFAGNEARIVEQVRSRISQCQTPTVHRHPRLLERVGRTTIHLGRAMVGHVNYLGAAVVGLGRSLVQPRTIRVRELTTQFEHVCLNAIPVVALVTLLIGVVIAYLLGLQAEKYGANIFVVDGVGIGATREFAPIIVAVIVAGRSGAAFTAQLGSMRLTEETDAIRTLGLSPLDVLMLPRVIALMIAMPLLVFIGDTMSLLGAILIAQPMLDITPTTFIERLRDSLEIKHVYVGLIKAPVFALVIAVIGCRNGMTVERDTRAVGMATTSTVVQSIVSVILLDAGFAVLFQELGI